MFQSRTYDGALALRCALTRPRGGNVEGPRTALKATLSSPTGAADLYRRCRGRLGSFTCSELSRRGQLAYSVLLLCFRAETSLKGGDTLSRPLKPNLNIRTRLPVLLTRCAFQAGRSVSSCLGLLDAIEPCFRDVVGLRGRGSRSKLFVDSAALSHVLGRYRSFITGPSSGCVSSVFTRGLGTFSGPTFDDRSRGGLYACRRGLVLARIVPTCRGLTSDLRDLHNANGDDQNLTFFRNKHRCCLCLLRDRAKACMPIKRVRGEVSTRLLSSCQRVSSLLGRSPSLVSELGRYSNRLALAPARVLRGLPRLVGGSFPRLGSTSCRLHAIRPSVGGFLDPTFCLAPPISAQDPGMVCVGSSKHASSLRLFNALTRRKFPNRLCRAISFTKGGPSSVECLIASSNCMRN